MTRVSLRGMQLGIPTLRSVAAALWNPLDDAALAGWWAGDSGTWQDTGGTTPATADGQTVARWSDLSGNSRHFIDSVHVTGSTLAAAYRAGKNCISFNGTTDMLGVSFTRTYPCTIYMALYIPAGTVVGTRFLINSRTDPNRSSVYISGGTTNISASNSTPAITLSSVTLGAWLYLATVFDGGNSRLTLNNTSTTTGNIGAATQNGLVLAGSPYYYTAGTVSGVRTKMIVGEIILIQSSHDVDQQTRVYEYLQSRWEA